MLLTMERGKLNALVHFGLFREALPTLRNFIPCNTYSLNLSFSCLFCTLLYICSGVGYSVAVS